jgi:phenylalanyl-tRNA synthetase alpha chain
MSDIFETAQQTIAAIAAESPANIEALETFRIRYLGSKGLVKNLMEEMRQVPNEQKRAYGQLMNTLKQQAEEKYQSLKSVFEAQSESGAGQSLDLTAPGEPLPLGSRHPVAVTLNRIVEIFTRMGFSVADGPEIEDDWHNFTAMNTPEDHPARDMQDTFYVVDAPGMLLRTHTSPVQARVMENRKPPIRIIAPGRVYRNETISARSHCQFHQVEGLYMDEGVSFADLKQTLLYFAQEMFGATRKSACALRFSLSPNQALKWTSGWARIRKKTTASPKAPAGSKYSAAAWLIRRCSTTAASTPVNTADLHSVWASNARHCACMKSATFDCFLKTMCAFYGSSVRPYKSAKSLVRSAKSVACAVASPKS